jgi:hypothetical protein
VKVTVLTYRHRHGADVFAHETEGGALKHAADLCLEFVGEVHPKYRDAIGLAHARKEWRTVVDLFETNTADTNHPEGFDFDTVEVLPGGPELADVSAVVTVVPHSVAELVFAGAGLSEHARAYEIAALALDIIAAMQGERAGKMPWAMPDIRERAGHMIVRMEGVDDANARELAAVLRQAADSQTDRR